MKNLVKLLLLAALAWPGTALAQGQALQSETKALESVKKAPATLLDTKRVVKHEHHHERGVEVAAPRFATQQTSAESTPVFTAAAPRKAEGITPVPSAGMVTRQIVEERTVTVYNGTNTNQNLPIAIRRLQYDARGQMIYPASELSLPIGAKIKSITFYANGNLTVNNGSESNPITLKLGTTTTSSYPRNNASYLTDITTVCTLPNILTGTTTATFTLDEPFTYNGNNLIVDLSCSALANAAYAGNRSWYGAEVTGYYSYYTSRGNNSTTTQRQQFLPKMTVVYEISDSYEAELPVAGDSTFFAQFNYTWKSSEGKDTTSNLTEIATDPDQIIAMLREVYMNTDIPGNWKRGYTENGFGEYYNDVYYSGIGSISRSGGYNSANYYRYSNSYGWNIPGNIKFGSVEYDAGDTFTAYYAHLDTTQYKPNQDGVTLLLLEMVDNYNRDNIDTSITDPYAQLKEYISKSVKSARVVKSSVRTGDWNDYSSGILFKIDCDKMNKFFLLAKGQLRWFHDSYYAPWVNNAGTEYIFGVDCSAPPCYLYSRSGGYYSTTFMDQYNEDFSVNPFFHMFEQFSPVADDAVVAKSDIYQDLVNMNSFAVEHDCMGVTYMGHQFQMYGDDSQADDCQDVRDMMFFVPDYRMMYHKLVNATDTIARDVVFEDGSESVAQKFRNYNPAHAPTMGLYVIRQDEIVANEQAEDYYKLTLTWDSNMDEFLPGEQQKYHLLQLVQDELGNDIYVPVYYTNANGQYTDANGNVLLNQNDTTSWVPVDVVVAPSADKKTYTEVYVPRLSGSQQVTYAIQGQDVDEFLSLQVSNQQSYIIPGKDPAEMILLSDATHYSRFNPQTVKNCYSNKLKIENNPHGVRPEYLTDGTQFTFKRMTSLDDANPVTIATATVSGASATGGTLNIVMAGQNLISEFPAGKTEGEGAGYHHNPGTMDAQGNYTWTLNYRVLTEGSSAGDVDFGKFIIYDNFVEDVSDNEHANQYFYKVEFTTATPFQGLNNESTSNAYSNSFRIPVYKTDSRINLAYDKAAVDADGVQVEGSEAAPERMELPENVQFDELVRRSSKTEILRYDTYRWNSEKPADFFIVDGIYGEDDEQDLPPHGIAGNQGEYYTVSMNAIGTPDYMTSETSVASGQGWAQFVDKVPHAASSASSYTYAPVVELFTKGLDVTEEALRTDYNTYGGPLQKVAVGKVDAEFVTVDGGFETSTMTWQQNGKTYCYYNLPVRLKVFDIPAGYEVYKVRAWRQVDESLLGECPQSAGPNVPDRSDRISGDYLFEELTYGDEFNISGGVRLQAFKEVPGGYELGDRARPNGENNERMATFGAVKLENGQTMDVTVIVRVYFTKANADAAMQAAGGPRRALTLENLSADGKYYVAEKVVTRTLSTNNVITAVNSVKASREVAGVTYVNTVGQVSNRPWQGVNVVITRYTDGTTRTTKAVY